MKQYSILSIFTILLTYCFSSSLLANNNSDNTSNNKSTNSIEHTKQLVTKKFEVVEFEPEKPKDVLLFHVNSLYNELRLESSNLPFQTFFKAMVGYYNMESALKKKNIISIVDFDKSSTKERLYVIDLANKKLLFHSLVAHGKNTGFDMAENFSNTHQSLQSSLGFYTTAETYQGHFGYALRLDGKERGFNSNARARGIVMHGATYVNRNIIASQKRLGRSYGCPAIPYSIHKEVIDAIKGGSMFYIHKNTSAYSAKSKLLNKATATKAFKNSVPVM